MNIHQASEASGLTGDTIRFYEKKGILPRPPRQANRYRAYTDEHVATLRLARGLRQMGVPLDEVRPILEVAHAGVCGEIRGSLHTTLKQVVAGIDAQISDLRATRRHAARLLEGLAAMQPEETSVPGADACPCIALVTRG